MVEIETILELIAQQQPPPSAYLLGGFFLIGLIACLTMGCVVAGLWRKDKQRFEKEAASVGVSLDLGGGARADTLGIEGCGYCFGFFIIIAAGAMGIAIPVILPEATEFLIVMIVMILFGCAFWGVALGSVPYIRSYRRGFRKALQNAIDNKTESQ